MLELRPEDIERIVDGVSQRILDAISERPAKARPAPPALISTITREAAKREVERLGLGRAKKPKR